MGMEIGFNTDSRDSPQPDEQGKFLPAILSDEKDRQQRKCPGHPDMKLPKETYFSRKGSKEALHGTLLLIDVVFVCLHIE